jgi:hypothetical protein
MCSDGIISASVVDPDLDPYGFGPARSASGSVSHKYGFEDPDPYQNVTDP